MIFASTILKSLIAASLAGFIAWLAGATTVGPYAFGVFIGAISVLPWTVNQARNAAEYWEELADG